MTKKRGLERELTRAGWVKLAGGESKHDKFRKEERVVTVPRHRELRDTTALGILREAGLR